MKSKKRKNVSGGGVIDKKASEPKGEKRSASARPMPAGQRQKPGDQLQPETHRLKDNTPNDFPIIGIGAFAGGLKAFTELLKHLPLDTGMGSVLVQHLDPQHESTLRQLVTRATPMPVREVTNNLRVEVNNVYASPPNTNLGVAQGVLKLSSAPADAHGDRFIDSFLESLAHDRRERAIGVILSDGANTF